jgi:hypothetical protein
VSFFHETGGEILKRLMSEELKEKKNDGEKIIFQKLIQIHILNKFVLPYP